MPAVKKVLVLGEAYTDSVNLDDVNNLVFQKTAADFKAINARGQVMDSKKTVAMDDVAKNAFLIQTQRIPGGQLAYFANQSFIGYQTCALLAQNWLIYKCCSLPAKDAVRNGFEITINDGTKIDVDVMARLKECDKRYDLQGNCIELIRMGRIFGIRIVMFKIDSADPEYYEKPFNPDGIRPGSYRGMSQIDPYWILPQLGFESSSDPSSINFYEPTWWQIGGRRIHHTHLIIMRQSDLPDVLKPTYQFGGISIPQMIFNRVYCAERTANEAPKLTLTKRSIIFKTDAERAIEQQDIFMQKVNNASKMHDNYGIWAIDKESEDAMQLDTNLADVDSVIMTQYQLVAAVAEIPITRLMGTVPKGFNATGEYDEASYHETIKSYQESDLTPLVQRHHLICIRSEVAPATGVEPFETSVIWNPLDEMTAKEKAELNKLKADTGAVYITSGVISQQEERQRIINDPTSSYNGLESELPVDMFSEPESEEDISNETPN